MRSNVLIGILLLILGFFALIYTGFNFTTHEQVAKVGPFEATQERQHTVYLGPVVGILAVAGGIAVLMNSRKHA